MLFVQLSENEKRFIIALLLLVILIFVIFGLLGKLITEVMKRQGKRLDKYVSDAVKLKVITEPNDFKKYANKKNRQRFIKEAWIPIVIMLVGVLALLLRDIIYQDFSYNPFNDKDGFGNLFFQFDFNAEGVKQKFFGITLIADWAPVSVYPHPSWESAFAYIFVFCLIVGGIWYLIAVQAFIARKLRIRKLSISVFDNSLEGYNQNDEEKKEPDSK